MILSAIASILLAAAPAPASADALWRLDCGALNGMGFHDFSDTHGYDGETRDMTVSCYLIKHGDEYLLWDAGLSPAAAGGIVSVTTTVAAQLARIGVKPEQIRYIGISHRHSDHTGQAADFPTATLLIGRADFEQLKTSPDKNDRAGLLPWLDGGAKAELVSGDKDVFGDGSVTILRTPGHTAGHHVLLVRLAGSGWVLLSGDLFHARTSYERGEIPAFNHDRADTMASIDRFRRIADNLKAVVIVQHEPLDIAKLPAFPEAAR